MPALSEDDLDPDPIAQFHAWYADAGTDAMALVTASADARPGGRMVLLKSADERGFTFFTNYTSPKARDLDANPRAALLFHWPPDRQVRATGSVARVDPAESDRYWGSRPRGSQLSAWASHQSEVVADRAALEARVAEVATRFPAEIPRPPFWGGFRLVPDSIEFWHHREDRLHDRLRYRRHMGAWLIERLSP
ncbi:MAG TPA: pyridoxamine 5'-phosphate oxidase [Acidimicrobiales bacterium]|nr:pyridoxamine 5'-phosphate oxidase [Acidimicrobiales bacterium]